MSTVRTTYPTLHGPIPGAVRSVGGALAMCQEARQLVEFAVRQRRKMMGHGHSRLDHHTADSLLRPLEVWLGHNPTPGRETLRLFWAKYSAALRVLMPGNAPNKLERLDTLMNQL